MRSEVVKGDTDWLNTTTRRLPDIDRHIGRYHPAFHITGLLPEKPPMIIPEKYRNTPKGLQISTDLPCATAQGNGWTNLSTRNQKYNALP